MSLRQRMAEPAVPRPSVLGISLLAAMGMAPFVHAGIAVLAPFIITDLGLSRTQVGALTSIAFLVATFGGPLLGKIADALGGRAVIAGLFLAGSLSLTVLGLAPNYAWMVGACLLSGLALGAANPATNQLIGASMPQGSRGTVLGVKQSGVKMGQLVSSATLPMVATALGWRPAFFVSGVTAVIVGSLATVVLPRHRDDFSVADDAGKRDLRPSFVPMLVVYGLLMGIPQSAVSTYLPLYAFERLSFSPAAAGAVAAVVGLVGVFARIALGRAIERVESLSRPLTAIALGTAFSFLGLGLAGGPAPEALVWPAAILFAATAPLWLVVSMLAVIAGAGARATGQASAMVVAGFSAGFVVGPLAFGATVDWLGSYRVAWAVGGLLAVGAAGVAASSSRLRLLAPG